MSRGGFGGRGGGGRGGFRGRGRGGSFGGRGGRGGGRGGFRSYDSGPPESVMELGYFMHTCEDDLVCKVTIDDVPFFNAPIFLENKQQIGQIDEIFGPIRDYFVSVKLAEDIKANSFVKKQKIFIDPNKILPLGRFLPKPPGTPATPGRGRGGRGGRGGGGRGGGRGFGRGGGFGGRGGGRGGYDRGGRGGYDRGGRGGYDRGGRGGYDRGGRDGYDRGQGGFGRGRDNYGGGRGGGGGYDKGGFKRSFDGANSSENKRTKFE